LRLWYCALLVALLLSSSFLIVSSHRDELMKIGEHGRPSSPSLIQAPHEEIKSVPSVKAIKEGEGKAPGPRPAHPYVHEGDLVIDGGMLAFTGEEVEVRGNIIIRRDGMLLLTNVVLFINQSYAYQFGIYIMDSGLLNAWTSRIYSNYPFNITCEDRSRLDVDATRLECSVSCKDTATVILKNSTAFLVSCYGGMTEFRSGTSSSVALGFSGSVKGSISVSPGHFPYWSIRYNTTITGAPFTFEVRNATVTGWFLCLSGGANVTVQDSELVMVNCRGTASLHMQNTTFGSVVCSGSSSAQLSECSGSILSCMNYTNVEVRNSDLGVSVVLEDFSPDEPLTLRPGEVGEFSIEHGLRLRLVNTYVRSWDIGLVDSQLGIRGSVLTSLSCYGSTRVEARNTTIVHIYLEGSSEADVYRSTLSSMTCKGSSRLRLFGTSFLPLMDVREEAEILVFWYLNVSTTLAGELLAGAEVAVYFANSSLADTRKTGSNGVASFLLMEKRINSTGEWPLGAYHVVATYGGLYEEEEDVELTDNTVIRLELGFELRVKCVDGDGDLLAGALVVAGGLSALTGPDGWALIDGLKNETTMVEVFVWGVKVAEVKLIWGSNFTGDTVIEPLECAVYDMAVLVRYQDGKPAAKALVTLLWLNETSILTLATNSTGWAVFENIPAGAYRVKVVKEGYEDVKIYVLLQVEDQVVQITLKPAKPPGGEGFVMPWNILIYAVAGSMVFIVVVAIAASLKRKKAPR